MYWQSFRFRVMDLLLNTYKLSLSDVNILMSKYESTITMALENDQDIKPEHLAYAIHHDHTYGFDPMVYHNWLDFFYSVCKELADSMRIPEPKKKEIENCWTCGIFKYVNEPCRSCGNVNKSPKRHRSYF